MKRPITRIAAISILALSLSIPAAAQAEQRGRVPLVVRQRIAIRNFAFRPATVTISRGTRVVWVNRDSATHTTTSNTGLWDRTLASGERFSRVFRRRGRFPYHCTIHPSMTGVIRVR